MSCHSPSVGKQSMMHKNPSNVYMKQMKYIFDGDVSFNLLDTECDQEKICMSLQQRNGCAEEAYTCKTLKSCTGDDCICYVSSKCNDQGGPGSNTVLGSLLKTGATCIDMEPDKEPVCKDMCSHLHQQPWICQGSKSRFKSCHSEFSCKDTCKCWINVECDKKYDYESELKEVAETETPGISGNDYYIDLPEQEVPDAPTFSRDQALDFINKYRLTHLQSNI